MFESANARNNPDLYDLRSHAIYITLYTKAKANINPYNKSIFQIIADEICRHNVDRISTCGSKRMSPTVYKSTTDNSQIIIANYSMFPFQQLITHGPRLYHIIMYIISTLEYYFVTWPPSQITPNILIKRVQRSRMGFNWNLWNHSICVQRSNLQFDDLVSYPTCDSKLYLRSSLIT